MIPEGIKFWSVSDGTLIKDLPFADVAFKNAQNVVLEHGVTMADAFYSFGICHPGAITLHNYPHFLRQLPMKDENGDSVKDANGNDVLLDLAAVDIMRDRERGVPRYNQFRQLIHRPPVTSFDEITSNRIWAQELNDVYGGDVDRVDLMVGMFRRIFRRASVLVTPRFASLSCGIAPSKKRSLLLDRLSTGNLYFSRPGMDQ